MNASLASSDQVRALQANRKRAGIDDETWRARLRLVSGQESTKGLTTDQASALLDDIRQQPAAPDRMAGPYGAKARALWIAAWNLGIAHDRSDKALLAFVYRQTGIETLTWVHSASDGSRVIEALKAWLARDGGVEWRRFSDPRAAVLHAIAAAVSRREGITWSDLLGWLAPKVGALGKAPVLWSEQQLERGHQLLGSRLRKGAS